MKLAFFKPIIFFLAVGACITCLSAPFRKTIEYRQPGGTVLTLWGEGDEFYAVFETLDGFTVVFDETLGGYCYARLSPAADQLLSTGVAAEAPVPAGLERHLRLTPEAVKALSAPKRQQWEADTGIRQRWSARKAALSASSGASYAPPQGFTVGQKTGLTLLIDFDDDVGTIPRESIDSFCNADAYTGYNNNGSVKKYFLDNSNGKLTYSNIVTIYVRAPQPKSYYNDTTKDAGTQGRKLIVDVLAVLKALPNYDTEILPLFSALSTDSQNRVLACNVFYAGGNGGRWSYGLWPHSWVLSSPVELSPGGKKVYYYQITDIGTRLELGTFCHENGHMLCDYPDIYDYDYDSTGGAGYFCLMNSGGSGGSGLNPTQICAYLKRASGWATTIDLAPTAAANALVSSVGTNFNVFYRFQKPGVTTEYYLVECRHKSNRDSSLPASGIAVWHVDELGDHNDQSLTPNTAHNNYEVTLVQADGRWDFQKNRNHGDTTDLYHAGNTASGYVNQLTDTTSPNAHWWNGSPSGIFLKNFSPAGTNMTFQVGTNEAMPLIVAHPLGVAALQGYPVSFTANASGEQPLAFQWMKDGSPIAGATSTSYLILSVGMTDAGLYSFRATNPFGTALSSNAPLSVIPTVPLPFALNGGSTWITDPALPWYGQTNASHDGVASARTHLVQDGQNCTLQYSVNGPCAISFWWRVSSQAEADILSFSVGSTSMAQRSGEGAWQQESFYLPAGAQTLRWTYSKNASGKAGQDCAWLDEVTITPGITLPFITSHPASRTGLEGVPVTFEAAANGTPPLRYQWLFQGVPVVGATSNVLHLASPRLANAGEYTLSVISDFGSVTSAPALFAIVPIATAGNGAFGQSTVSTLATNVLAISAGGWHSLALTKDLKVLAWGNPGQGQCEVPPGLAGVAAISAGGYHNLALRLDGSVAAWGANNYSQCTVPAAVSNCIAIAAGDWHSAALTAGGKVVVWGDNAWGQRNVPLNLVGVAAISAGSAHTLALRTNGTVAAWGSNLDGQGFYAGQSTVPAGLTNVVAVSAGGAHSVALKRDGSLVIWGSGYEGQLQKPSGLVAQSVSAGGSHTIALRQDGSATGWGANSDGQCDVPTTLTNVIAVSAGRAHTLLLLGGKADRSEVLAVNKRPGSCAVFARLLPGRPHSLEYKDTLRSPAWITLPPVLGGDAPQILLDSAASSPQRFYRIRQW